jgi:hypothetical protein
MRFHSESRISYNRVPARCHLRFIYEARHECKDFRIFLSIPIRARRFILQPAKLPHLPARISALQMMSSEPLPEEGLS